MSKKAGTPSNTSARPPQPKGGQGAPARSPNAPTASTASPIAASKAPATASAQASAARPAPRRSTRQEQWEQRRIERERAAQQAQRRKWTWRISFIAGGVIVLGLIVYLTVTSLQQTGAGSLVTGKGTYTTAADGSARDGMSCLGSEGGSEHIHMYLAVYIDGKQYQIPGDTGVLNSSSCLYPLHVHSDSGDENIIHEESPNNATYTLGAFFDLWGQPLSRTKVLSYTADATHKLVFVTIDGNGKKTVVTSNPLGVKLAEHETIYVLYNSPTVTPQAFTKWLPGE